MTYYKYNVVALYEVAKGKPLHKHVEKSLYFAYAVERARGIIKGGFSEHLQAKAYSDGMYSFFVPPHRIFEVQLHRFEVSEDEYSRKE